MFRLGDFQATQRVLDVGCGVATTAIEIARRFGADVTAVDISSLMLSAPGAMFAKRMSPGRSPFGKATSSCCHSPMPPLIELLLKQLRCSSAARPPPASLSASAGPGRAVINFLGASRRRLRLAKSSSARSVRGWRSTCSTNWVRLYREAGLDQVQVTTGPFEMMTPLGFMRDEGVFNSLVFMGRTLSRLADVKKMAWLMPRMQRAVPYLGYVVVVGVKSTT